MDDLLDLPPQARAARITYLMVLRGRLTAEEIREMTGIQSRRGALRLMDNISLGRVPVYQPEPGVWEILPSDRLLELLD